MRAVAVAVAIAAARVAVARFAPRRLEPLFKLEGVEVFGGEAAVQRPFLRERRRRVRRVRAPPAVARDKPSDDAARKDRAA